MRFEIIFAILLSACSIEVEVEVDAAVPYSDADTLSEVDFPGYRLGFPELERLPPRDSGPDLDSGSDGSDVGPPDAGPSDAGSDAGPPDAGSDAGPPDAGPPDAGSDAGPSDAGPSDAGSDAGPPDAGPAPCVGMTSRFVTPSSRTWIEAITSTSIDDRGRLHGPLVYPTGTYRLGVQVTAPGSSIEIVVRCAFLVQVCADQTDTSRLVSGSDTCRVTGSDAATMGISCSSDDPPRSFEVRVESSMCAPSGTVQTLEVVNPHIPSTW